MGAIEAIQLAEADLGFVFEVRSREDLVRLFAVADHLHCGPSKTGRQLARTRDGFFPGGRRCRDGIRIHSCSGMDRQPLERVTSAIRRLARPWEPSGNNSIVDGASANRVYHEPDPNTKQILRNRKYQSY